MEYNELKKIFGGKLKTFEVKPPTFDIPKAFSGIAVYLPEDFTEVLTCPAEILPAKKVKRHGVVPMSKEEKEKYDNLPPSRKPFNCYVGDYFEMVHEVWMKDAMHMPMYHAHHEWGMPDGFAMVEISDDRVGALQPCKMLYKGWKGYFKSIADAKEAVMQKIASHRSFLKSEMAKLDKCEAGLAGMQPHIGEAS